jgi:hypothetical protein
MCVNTIHYHDQRDNILQYYLLNNHLSIDGDLEIRLVGAIVTLVESFP